MKFTFLGLIPCCSTRDDLSIDVSITNVRQCMIDIDEAKVISARQYKSKYNFDIFEKKKIKFLGFHAVVVVETFPLMHQLPM